MMVGAILTQTVSWNNVKKAIGNLENAGLLTPEAIFRADEAKLELLVLPTGYYKAKTKKLKAFVAFLLEEFQGDLSKMWQEEPAILRRKLLNIYGMGPETVDSILLYAGDIPIFVVDAYTRRIFNRIGWISEEIKYYELQNWFMKHLERDSKLYNEFHALIVRLGNQVCKNQANCPVCPVVKYCQYAKQNL